MSGGERPHHDRREHIMALEKLIKNSIDTDSNYASLYDTAINTYDIAFACTDDSQAGFLLNAYRIVARELQECLWSEWGMWLEAHNCDKAEFHRALANVLTDGVSGLWEARVEAEFKSYVEGQNAA